MKTIKVIDLLNMISKGEELPKKIYQHCEMFGNATFELDNGVYLYKKIGGNIDFIAYQTTDTLNDLVEIIEDTPKEDKKIEKLENKIDTTFENATYSERMRLTEIINKINEIIDKVNGDSNE